MARPPLPDDQRRSELVKFRVSKDEQTAIMAGADAAEVAMSEFVRDASLAKAKAVTRKRAATRSRAS